jgi:exodeoxyribonuclease VII large subunit
MPAPRREPNLHAFVPPETTIAVQTAAGEPPARSVTEVVATIRMALASDPALSPVWVRGEISGFNAHGSGHWYFALKDATAVLSAVMWRGMNARVKFRPEEGMEVLARGRVDVYAQRGSMQLVVEELRPVGAGELALRFEQLKRKLEAEGLFAQARKRALPPYPRAVGLVTSLQAAALRDMMRVATTRHPGLRLVVANARVQGEGAAAEIAAAIARLNAQAEVDVIIVGRGGGSAEDLWAFNEEVVVRAVAGSNIPVVSAVGHETDHTLCDIAADARAATPSNACELVVPDAEAIHAHLDDSDARMAAALERLVPELNQELDDLDTRAQAAMARVVATQRERIGAHAARLDALSPLAVLARGYAVVTKDGRAARSVEDAVAGDDIQVRAVDGEWDAKVTRRRKYG